MRNEKDFPASFPHLIKPYQNRSTCWELYGENLLFLMNVKKRQVIIFYLASVCMCRVKGENIVCMNRFTFDTKDCKSFPLAFKRPRCRKKP